MEKRRRIHRSFWLGFVFVILSVRIPSSHGGCGEDLAAPTDRYGRLVERFNQDSWVHTLTDAAELFQLSSQRGYPSGHEASFTRKENYAFGVAIRQIVRGIRTHLNKVPYWQENTLLESATELFGYFPGGVHVALDVPASQFFQPLASPSLTNIVDAVASAANGVVISHQTRNARLTFANGWYLQFPYSWNFSEMQEFQQALDNGNSREPIAWHSYGAYTLRFDWQPFEQDAVRYERELQYRQAQEAIRPQREQAERATIYQNAYNRRWREYVFTESYLRPPLKGGSLAATIAEQMKSVYFPIGGELVILNPDGTIAEVAKPEPRRTGPVTFSPLPQFPPAGGYPMTESGPSLGELQRELERAEMEHLEARKAAGEGPVPCAASDRLWRAQEALSQARARDRQEQFNREESERLQRRLHSTLRAAPVSLNSPHISPLLRVQSQPTEADRRRVGEAYLNGTGLCAQERRKIYDELYGHRRRDDTAP